jgi:C1A family cysteine protease
MTTIRKIKRYGWIPDTPDQRDLYYSVRPPVMRKLPARVDFRDKCPGIYDQGGLGSCTANAIAAAHQFNQIRKDSVVSFIPSRLFIYYNEREIEGTVKEDSGACLRDGIKTVVKQGVCPEHMWPYVLTRFKRKPYNECYDTALNNQVISYRRINQTLDQMRGCLAEGFPFVFGCAVYPSFEDKSVTETGKVPLPSLDEVVLGGHAMMAVGYDDAEESFIVRNSWGEDWGLHGYCLMPYAYLTNGDLASDFWTIRSVEINNVEGL